MSEFNILLIDDNRDLADGYGLLLEDEGYRVSIAYNGRDGVNAYNNGDFDLLLIDAKLPDTNGVALFHQVRVRNPEARAILITGYRIEQLIAEVAGQGDVEILRGQLKFESILNKLGQLRDESIIFVVGSDLDFPEKLVEYLSDNKVKNLLVRDQGELSEYYLSDSVEVMILDLQLPVIWGLEAYLGLKQEGRAVKTIIVAGNASNKTGDIDILRSTQVTGCLFKPFRLEELLRAVEKALAA